MRLRPASFSIAVASAILLAGCALSPVGRTPSLSGSGSPTGSSTSASVEPTTPAPTTPSPTTSQNPYLPTLDGAIDVGSVYSSFAIPSGAFACATNGVVAECMFPSGMRSGVPTGTKVCKNARAAVVGVTISKGKAQYMCLGSPFPFPAADGLQVAWHAHTGFPWITKAGVKLAVLPAGHKLASGDLVCESRAKSARCGNVATGHGFTLSKEGPTFF